MNQIVKSENKEEINGIDTIAPKSAILGRSNETDEFIYIKHSDTDTVYEIPTTAAIHSKLLRESVIENITTDTYGKVRTNPIIITIIKADTMDFIVKYMLRYNDKIEKFAPESPIKNIHISIIFGDEYDLFANIYDEKDSLKTKIIKINNFIESALYFDFKHLHRKLCAIIASLLLDVDIDELKSIKN